MNIDYAYAHLLVNHLPIVGLGFGLLITLLSLVPKLRAFAPAGLLVLTLAGASAWPAFVTGEGGEEKVEHMAGASESALEAHEHAAKPFLLAALALAGVSAVGLGIGLKKGATPTAAIAAPLVAGLVAMNLAVNTGRTGGKIRRPELRGTKQASNWVDSKNHDEEEEEEEREEEEEKEHEEEEKGHEKKEHNNKKHLEEEEEEEKEHQKKPRSRSIHRPLGKGA